MYAPRRVSDCLPEPPTPTEQRAAAREAKEARDARQVLESVHEEDELHLEQLVDIVELLHVLLRHTLALRLHVRLRDRLVDARRGDGLLRDRVEAGLLEEVDKVEGGRVGEAIDVGAELAGVRLEHDKDLLAEPRLVLLVDELVREDAHALVLPESEQ